MKPRGARIPLLGLIAAVVASLALVAPASSGETGKRPAKTAKNVFWIDLSGTAKQHPKFVYFTANSGGQVHSIKWKGWGKKKTVGKGIFHDSSPSFPGKLNQEGPARLVAWKPVKCTPEFGNRKGKNVRVYRHVKMRYRNGKGGKKWVDVTHTAGWLTCKQS